MEVYDELAEHYDLIYGDQLDTDFYLREARNARGRVLEVACGTGRILLRLLEEGIDAEGLDLSESMLAVLKKKATSMGLKPTVYQANMVDFKLGKYNLIIVPYRSFLHLKSEKERKDALRNFMDHLEKGGRLVLHTYSPSEEDRLMSGGYHLFETES